MISLQSLLCPDSVCYCQIHAFLPVEIQQCLRKESLFFFRKIRERAPRKAGRDTGFTEPEFDAGNHTAALPAKRDDMQRFSLELRRCPDIGILYRLPDSEIQIGNTVVERADNAVNTESDIR